MPHHAVLLFIIIPLVIEDYKHIINPTGRGQNTGNTIKSPHWRVFLWNLLMHKRTLFSLEHELKYGGKNMELNAKIYRNKFTD